MMTLLAVNSQTLSTNGRSIKLISKTSFYFIITKRIYFNLLRSTDAEIENVDFLQDRVVECIQKPRGV